VGLLNVSFLLSLKRQLSTGRCWVAFPPENISGPPPPSSSVAGNSTPPFPLGRAPLPQDQGFDPLCTIKKNLFSTPEGEGPAGGVFQGPRAPLPSQLLAKTENANGPAGSLVQSRLMSAGPSRRKPGFFARGGVLDLRASPPPFFVKGIELPSVGCREWALFFLLRLFSDGKFVRLSFFPIRCQSFPPPLPRWYSITKSPMSLLSLSFLYLGRRVPSLSPFFFLQGRRIGRATGGPSLFFPCLEKSGYFFPFSLPSTTFSFFSFLGCHLISYEGVFFFPGFGQFRCAAAAGQIPLPRRSALFFSQARRRPCLFAGSVFTNFQGRLPPPAPLPMPHSPLV